MVNEIFSITFDKAKEKEKRMAYLIIRNIGPIKEIAIELNKVNVIMGPQSSGKSTICKIASFCSWVEKKICSSQSIEMFTEKKYFEEQLMQFHKLEGYFFDDSYIEYQTDSLTFTYSFNDDKVKINWVDHCKYKRAKIAYIPSERNIVSAISNWFEVKFKDTNIRNFMIDWDDSRKKYSRRNPLQIINLNARYYFDESTGRDVVIVNGNKKLELTNTSSGLQSLIPLLVLIEYLVKHINEQDDHSSVLNEQIKKKVNQQIYERYFEVKEVSLPSEGSIQNLFVDTAGNDFAVKVEEEGYEVVPNSQDSGIKIFKSREKKAEYDLIIEHLFRTQSVNLFIEEPEQNLFPQTQLDLLYELISLVVPRENDSMTITTHSPYVLYALNNCMMGYLVRKNMPEEEQKHFASRSAWINPELISIWEIKEGYLIGMDGKRNSTIQQPDGLIGDNYFDRNMKEVMDDFYKMLNYYSDDKDED